MRCLVRLEAAESGQKPPKSVISRRAVQSVVNRIGGAGEGRRESCSPAWGAAIGHPRPQDAVAAIRFGKSPRRIRPAPRPGGGAGGRAFRRRALGAAPRFADSEPPAPLRRVCAALSGSDRRRGCDRSQSAPSGRAGGVRGGDRRRLTDSRRAGANRSASAWDGRARGRDRRRAIDSRRGGAGRAFRPCAVGNLSPVAAGALMPPLSPRALTTHPPLAANGRRSSMESFADCAQSRSLSEQSKPTPALRMRPDTGRWRFGKCFLAR